MNGMRRVIYDLCAGTGAWSAPYVEAGYDVHRIDLRNGLDVRLLPYTPQRVHGILAAPPCTTFSYARNRYEPKEDELRDALSIVDACLRAVVLCRPSWWALENPVNKLRRYLGPPRWTFRQWQYGDPGEKPTALWGTFEFPMFLVGPRRKPSTYKTSRQNAEPWDAVTPPNFARAFFEANP
jgi:site-specific DNA-cytosine methylase